MIFRRYQLSISYGLAHGGRSHNTRQTDRQTDRHCTYNVTMRRVHATIVVVVKQKILHKLTVCIYCLRYPTRQAHAPYCHLWPAPLCNIFLHYLTKGKILKKTLLSLKCMILFSLQLLSATFLILGRNERDMIKNVYRSSCKVPFILVRP